MVQWYLLSSLDASKRGGEEKACNKCFKKPFENDVFSDFLSDETKLSFGVNLADEKLCRNEATTKNVKNGAAVAECEA